jgi:hypothetical protein
VTLSVMSKTTLSHGTNQPLFPRTLPPAATSCERGSLALAPMNPEAGIVDCCARATIGHAAAPPRAAMNARRLTHPSRKSG